MAEVNQIVSCVFRRCMVDRTWVPEDVCNIHAPPAMVFPQPLQCQIPTASRFTLFFPQNPHTYLECCVISIFLICFLSEAPYLTPYLPTIPTFFVLFAILSFYDEIPPC